jgi:hypothetical protein
MVTNVASGTPWNSSSGSGRLLVPGSCGQAEAANETACNHTLSSPGNRGGRVM